MKLDADAVPRDADVAADIRRLLDDPPAEMGDVHSTPLDLLREQFKAIRPSGGGADVAEVVDTSFEGAEGPVRVRIYRAETGVEAPVIIWYHGGGWVVGDLDTAEVPARALCALAGCTVVSVDYRLAPEHPFPAAFDDCLAAYDWVVESANELSVDPDRIIIGGDSAGGNLAAAVAVALRNGSSPVAGQLLIYPAVQAGFDTAAFDSVGDDKGLSAADMVWYWEQYVPGRRADWRASPEKADLAGVAPAFIFTCGFDPLAAEGIRYSHRLESAGVDVELLHYAGAVHGVFAMQVDSGTRSRSAAAEWVKRRVNG